MAFQPSNPHAFGYDMNANHLPYNTAQQRSNPQTEFYPKGKVADQVVSDVSMMPPNPHMAGGFRKDSLASTSGVLSPTNSSWEHKQQHQQHQQQQQQQLFPSAGFVQSHGFHETENNGGFVRHEQTPVYPHAPQEWVMSPAGSVDTTGFEPYPTKFEPSPFPGSMPSEHNPFLPAQRDHGFNSLNHGQNSVDSSVSPPALSDWTQMTGPRGIKTEKFLKPRHQPILKREGIRKKNAKIPIPAEITLENIDELMDACLDDDDLKQLKAQKRLLRNREAALASRQRKKKHTENLEAKEKDLEVRMHMLCQQVDTLKLQLENVENQKRFYAEEQAKASHAVETLQLEKQDLICEHTKETGNLRHQIRFLREQIESSPAPAMSVAPSSTGFTDFGLDIDHLQLEDHPWDRFINVHDPNNIDDSEYLGESFATIQPKPLPQQRESDNNNKDNSTDQPIASGILFMLLLCGAFVASRSSNTNPGSVVHKMPEEVRAASTEVLNNLLKDNPRQASMFMPELTQPHPTQPSDPRSVPWTSPHPSSTNNHNHMSTLHHRLTTPSKLQEAEQAFALTPAQYNSLTSYPTMPNNHPRPPQRNLAATLKSMHDAKPSNTGMAEVYTRSLLWDQIPEDVVRRFRQMVAESHSGDGASSSSTSGVGGAGGRGGSMRGNGNNDNDDDDDDYEMRDENTTTSVVQQQQQQQNYEMTQ